MKKKHVMRATLFCLILIVITLLVYYYAISKKFVINAYSIEGNVENKIKIVHLTDLHNAEWEKGNSKLVAHVWEQEPDLIVMTGDMINRDECNLDIIKCLLTELSKIAPVYYSYGNHENIWEENWGIDLRDELSETGAVVLNNEFVDTEICGQEIRIGGYMGYYRKPHMFTHDEAQKAVEIAFSDSFENTDRLKILLNHIPTQWVDWNYVDKYPVDIVFSGHFHGGLIRIPFIDRGIYAPYVGLLPKFTKGVYEGSQATCILSAGLGSEHMIPRLNNPPEIVVVNLLPYKN